jgi:hypothetical protein
MPTVPELLGMLQKEITSFTRGCERAFFLTTQRLLSDLDSVDPKKFREFGCSDSDAFHELLLTHYGRILRHETTDLTELLSALTTVFKPTVLAYALWVHVPQLTVRAAVAQQFIQRAAQNPAQFGAKEFLILNGMIQELRKVYDSYREWRADNDKQNELVPIMENAHWGAIEARLDQLGEAFGASKGDTKKLSKDTTKIIRKDE